MSVKTINVDVEEKECIRHDSVNLYKVLNLAIEKEEAICRLLLDLRDFAIKNV